MSRIFTTPFASVYPHYVTKGEKKGRTEDEVRAVIRWLTGADEARLTEWLRTEATFEEVFAQASPPEEAELITGSVCGVRVEEVEDPLMRRIRQLDKLVDELAKGKALDRVIRTA